MSKTVLVAPRCPRPGTSDKALLSTHGRNGGFAPFLPSPPCPLPVPIHEVIRLADPDVTFTPGGTMSDAVEPGYLHSIELKRNCLDSKRDAALARSAGTSRSHFGEFSAQC